MKRNLKALVFGTMLCALTLGTAEMAMANGLQAVLRLGRCWTTSENDGAEANHLYFPAGLAMPGKYSDGTGGDYARQWVCHGEKLGNYLWVTDWTDPEGTTYDDAGSYKFRTDNGNWPAVYDPTGAGGIFNYVFPINQQEYTRFARPKLIIATPDTLLDFVWRPGDEGMDTFTYPAGSGKGPRNAEIVDPTLVTEASHQNTWRYIEGVELNRTIYAYPYGTLSQDYFFEDITLTNNGICGRRPSELPPTTAEPPILDTQILTNVIWGRALDYRDKRAPDPQSGQDNECVWVEPWGAGNHVASLAYDLDDQTTGANSCPGPDIGDPAEDPLYMNLLLGHAYSIYGALFTSAGTGANYEVDDPAQPAFRVTWGERAFDFATKDYSPADTREQREYMCSGELQMGLNESYRTNPNTEFLTTMSQGPTAVMGFGPLAGEINYDNFRSHGWTMNPGESVHMLLVTASSGIDQELGRAIGQKWNQAKAANGVGDMSAADIALIQTGRDSVMKAAAVAYWNINREFAPNVTGSELLKWNMLDTPTQKPADYGPFDMVDGPRAPGFISVRPNPEGGVEVRWGTEAEGTSDHDTDVPDFAGYRIYRQKLSRVAPWEVIAEGPAEWFLERPAITDSLPAGRYLIDGGVVPGEEAFYCVVAYDDGTQNWEKQGRSIESVRWWTWSGFYNIGVTALTTGGTSVEGRASSFALDQNAPNPFNPTTSISFSVPAAGEASLIVYNAAGQVVRTLVDGNIAAGTHQISWDGTDNMGRNVASGVYVYRLVNDGRQLVRRMTLVR